MSPERVSARNDITLSGDASAIALGSGPSAAIAGANGGSDLVILRYSGSPIATGGTLVLTGANTYQGDTIVSAGTLVGTTTSLQGNIDSAAALVFDDPIGGTFTYNSQPLADGSRFFVGSQMWEIDYDYVYDTNNPTTTQPLNSVSSYVPVSGTQTFVTVTAVPEPSTYLMLAIGGGIGAIAARRRREAG